MRHMQRSYSVQTAILVAALALSAPAFAGPEAVPCLAAYQDAYKATWEIAPDDWAKLCARDGAADAAFLDGQKAFLDRCNIGAAPSVRANLIRADDAAALCAQGVPGRAKLPKTGAAVSVGGFSAPTAEQAAVQGRAQQRATSGVAASAGRINAALGGDVASLYGERTGSAVGDGGSAPAAGSATPLPRSGPRDPGLGEAGRTKTASPARSAPPPPVVVPYTPSDPAKAKSLIILDKWLMTNGASSASVSYLRERYRDMLEGLSPEVLQNLVNSGQRVAIIPEKKKLTEVAPFQALAGKKTFDGRKWETVRGVAGVPLGPGKHGCAVAIGEENLGGDGGGYPKGYTFFHEYGHAVKLNGLPPKTLAPVGFVEKVKRAAWGDPGTQQHVKEIYDASMKRPQKTGLDSYANSNDDEFYAQATAAFFGVGYRYYKTPEDKKKHVLTQETPVSLARANFDISKLCVSVYGTPGRYWKKE